MVRALISYAHEDDEHEEAVRQFWLALREHGVDAKIDLPAAAERQIWTEWMTEQIRKADYILVVASPAYRERAENRGAKTEGRGVRWESRQLQELLYANPDGGFRRVLPIVLPGHSIDELPDWMLPVSGHTYRVPELSAAGLEELLRVLTGQPLDLEPPPGPVTVLPPRTPGTPPTAPTGALVTVLPPPTGGPAAGSTADLINDLLDVPGMLEPAFRQWLYDGLPRRVAVQLPRDPRARLELAGLVDVFRDYSGLRPWRALLVRLDELVADHPSVQQVADRLAGLGLLEEDLSGD